MDGHIEHEDLDDDSMSALNVNANIGNVLEGSTDNNYIQNVNEADMMIALNADVWYVLNDRGDVANCANNGDIIYYVSDHTDSNSNRSRIVLKPNQKKTYKSAINGTNNFITPDSHCLASMDKVCYVAHCRAVHFANERGKLLHSCCHGGKIFPQTNLQYPSEFRELLTGTSKDSKNFREFIRQYNSANAFASFGANFKSIAGKGTYCLRVSGEVYHFTSRSLHAQAGETPSYAQLYVYDTDEAVKLRMRHPANLSCEANIMRTIDEVIRRVSPYANQYKKLKEAIEEDETRIAANGGECRDIQLLFTRSTIDDQRRYNAPSSTNEVAIIYVANHEGSLPHMVDVAVYPKNLQGPQRISMLSKHLDPMVFPLLFPHGEFGWTPGLKHHPGFATSLRNTVTAMQFYASNIAVRRNFFNPLHFSGKLFQQYLIHGHMVCESGRIKYLRENQKKLRVECYQGLLDHSRNRTGEGEARIGNVVILPSTFIGGPRHMLKLYHDSMATVRKFGRPDLFITFTCNPKWPEIQNELATTQTAFDRPDLVAKIFQLKVEEFMKDITYNYIFGKIIAWVYVIEEQKRGLPHLHGLFTLSEQDKFHTTTDIDNVVSAELPQSTDDLMYDLILKHNVHGPCGIYNPKSVCMVDGKCSKQFPKSFRDDTDSNYSAYPQYRRRNNSIENHSVRGLHVDNRYIVPYNSYLTKKFNAHINVEICSSVTCIKYIHKYISKGFDCARIKIQETANSSDNNEGRKYDEISEYINCRYVSAPEAAWRILENPISDHSHTVYLLSVHLPGGQSIYYNEGEEESVLRRVATVDTTLTAWFKLNSEDSQARLIYYQNIPNNYVFSQKKWKKRHRGGDKVIGRIPSISPRNVELYYLRLILLQVKGATSFESLRTVNGNLLTSYREVALALGIIDNDGEWHKCMEEASHYMMPKALRQLFVLILIQCQPANPVSIWNDFKSSMSEDFVHKGASDEVAINLALLNIRDMLTIENSSCNNHGLPEPDSINIIDSPTVNSNFQSNLGEEMMTKLNNEQLHAFDPILQSVFNEECSNNKCFFIDGPGGSGKTFLYKAIIHTLQGKGKNVLSLAWTGIAALLLPGGVTCHTAFNLPLNLQVDATCRVSSKNRKIIRDADLIIWDEAPMAPVTALDIIERTVRDIMNNDLNFGGKTVVLGGDFRQILPVCKKASRGQLVSLCIKSSRLWKHFTTYHLKCNMRALRSEIKFSQWLLDLGSGQLPHIEGESESSVLIPDILICQDVIRSIYNDVHTVSDVPSFSKRAILCPKNDHARFVNENVLKSLEGVMQTFYSIDKIIDEEGHLDVNEQINYPVEFLNSCNPNGLPPHILNLKIGAIIIILRNLSISDGLCNGTRMVVRNLSTNLIQAEIITGEKQGNIHFIPRISLNTSSDVTIPFNMSRKQFPVKLAYAMTINKSQGQTFDKVGLLLPEPVFTHGQLYVGCSRVRSETSLHIQIVEGPKQKKTQSGFFTENIVFNEVLH